MVWVWIDWAYRAMLIKDASFTIFDFETTGLYPYSGDRICEIGALGIGPGSRRVKKFHALVNPEMPISPGAFRVNGISEDMLEGQPVIDEILPGFLKFIKGTVLVAYNAGFDLGFLESALGEERAGLLDSYIVVDAMALARRLFPDIGRYNLGSVCESLGITVGGEHRAMADAAMTLELFKKELEALESAGTRDIAGIARPKTRRAVKGASTVKDYTASLIEEAIRRQKKLNIRYRSAWYDTVTERTITPKEIRRGYDRSYVVAYCHLKNDERNFRLDGILEAEPAE